MTPQQLLAEQMARCLAGDADVLGRFRECRPRPRWSVAIRTFPVARGESAFAYGLRVRKEPNAPAALEWAIYRLSRDGAREHWSVLQNASAPNGVWEFDESARLLGWRVGQSKPEEQSDLFDGREAGEEYVP